jgi:hypothetical protein
MPYGDIYVKRYGRREVRARLLGEDGPCVLLEFYERKKPAIERLRRDLFDLEWSLNATAPHPKARR